MNVYTTTRRIELDVALVEAREVQAEARRTADKLRGTVYDVATQRRYEAATEVVIDIETEIELWSDGYYAA